MSTSVEVKGKCDDRFSAVQEAFAKNFEDGLEIGASFAVTLNGEPVVDIWAGHADAGKGNPSISDFQHLHLRQVQVLTICDCSLFPH